jgi:hypothetical protein
VEVKHEIKNEFDKFEQRFDFFLRSQVRDNPAQSQNSYKFERTKSFEKARFS